MSQQSPEGALPLPARRPERQPVTRTAGSSGSLLAFPTLRSDLSGGMW
jgi:hypothetical protein